MSHKSSLNSYTTDRFTVQIVLRVYRSPVEALVGFDIDASACGFYQDRIWVTPRSRHALETGLLCVDVDRMSTTYNQRLTKYMYEKGFDLLLPMPAEVQHFLLASHPSTDEAMKDQKLLQCSLVGLIYLTIFEKRKHAFNKFFVDSEYCPLKEEEFQRRDLLTDPKCVVRVFFSHDGSLAGYGFPKPLLTPENLLGVDDLFARYRDNFEAESTSVPDRVQFLTVNPGRQHTARFHPQEISLRQWVDMSPLSRNDTD